MKKFQAMIFLVLSLVLAFSSVALGQGLSVDYTVKVASVRDRLFHVVADIKGINQPRLDLSLPVWTPGWYTIENYAKNVLRFRASDMKGSRLPHRMIRKQTWRILSGGLPSIRVEFDYRAEVLALNQAKIADDYAFFTGTQLFLMVEGHRNSPSRVRFEVPEGWKVISALDETSDPNLFSAPNYDVLVDCPTLIGKFDLREFSIEGKPHYLVMVPSGAFPSEKADLFVEMLKRIAKEQSAIFGGLPYRKYVYFYFFARPESNASGALEHANSHVAFAPPGPFAAPEAMIEVAAHEFFHLWNVKRIRPAELWPYDYSRERETPLLWFSEGITNYYEALTIYRAGLMTRDEFLQRVADAVSGVESNEARHYISPADSSVSTWLGYDTPVAFGISYYTQGQNLGALLDIKIRHDTGARRGLDDLMRALYQERYLKGLGFTTEDIIAIINRLTGHNLRDFFRRYVWGVEVPPYDEIFGYAGYKLERSSQRSPIIGISIKMAPEGAEVVRLEPGSPASEAGLEAGDLLLTIDGVEVRRGFRAVRARLSEKIGQIVPMIIKRGGEQKELNLKVAAREEESYRLVELPNPTAQQIKVREAWLRVASRRQSIEVSRASITGLYLEWAFVLGEASHREVPDGRPLIENYIGISLGYGRRRVQREPEPEH
jgi:predicted metalloprotease with PDZ domain